MARQPSRAARPDTHMRQFRQVEWELAGELVTRSFRGDAVNEYVLGDAMQALFTRLARYIYLKKGFGDVVEDAATGRPLASTLWLPPGEDKSVPLLAELAGGLGMLRDGGFKSLKRGFALDRVLTGKHPVEPHYYLFSIATEPEFQGMGFGGQVFRPALERIDREGMPAFLENSKERNIPFYMAHGFEITEEVKEPIPGCPPMWMMYRKPR